MTTSGPLAINQIVRQCESVLTRSLPPSWHFEAIYGERRNSRMVDAVFTLTTSRGERFSYIAEAQRLPTARSILNALEQNNGHIENDNRSGRALIVADYLSPRSRQVLVGSNVSYIDTTGNIRIINDNPGLFIEASGAPTSPWTETAPLRSLKGRGAGRAVRALVDTRPPFGVRELGLRVNVPIATLSRVIELLERDALLVRADDGGVLSVDWSNAIRRWSQDHELRKSNTVDSYLEPRGLAALRDKLSQTQSPYAITSSLAADQFSPIAPTQVATIYVRNSGVFAKEVGLRPVDSGANVLLIEPFDKVVFERTMRFGELVTAAPSQVAVDLLTGPGREPSEGEELLRWMKENVDAWQA